MKIIKFNQELHHRQSIRLRGYDYSRQGAYFITICVKNRELLFGHVCRGDRPVAPTAPETQTTPVAPTAPETQTTPVAPTAPETQTTPVAPTGPKPKSIGALPDINYPLPNKSIFYGNRQVNRSGSAIIMII
ncbi:MAG: hypothetical protein M0Q51_04720 [Bacteroidales bacterium]|nr:hypothetical protein [Bacteroidales bacterium]